MHHQLQAEGAEGEAAGTDARGAGGAVAPRRLRRHPDLRRRAAAGKGLELCPVRQTRVSRRPCLELQVQN